MKDQIFNYYYIDENSIGSLFAQLDKPYIDKVNHKIQNSTKGGGRARIGLGNILRKFGMLEADFDAKLNIDKMRTKEYRELLFVEHKIKAVFGALKKKKELVFLTKESFNSVAIDKSIFVELEALFRTPELKGVDLTNMLLRAEVDEAHLQEYSWKRVSERYKNVHRDAIKNIDKSNNLSSFGFVTFKCCMGKSLIHMGTSLTKYVIGLHHLMYAWHYRKVMLSVFGQITPIKENEFYLKPFTIRHA